MWSQSETECSECARCTEMQPHLLLLCCLLIFCSWSSSDASADFTVTQSASPVTVKEGGSVNITCCWNKTISGVKVKWYKDDRHTSDNGSNIVINTDAQKRCSSLFIKSFSKDDTGPYICEVTQDIPTLTAVKGNKTSVEVQEDEGTKANGSVHSSTTQNPTFTAAQEAPKSPMPMVVVSVSGAVALICLCVCLIVWRTYRKPERVVIREGPPSEGDDPVSEEDDSSRNSRGSTQWYMVPVYESYFDLQRNDEELSSKEEQCTKEDPSEKEEQSAKEEQLAKQQSVKRQSVKRQSLKRLSLKSLKRGMSSKKPNPDNQ